MASPTKQRSDAMIHEIVDHNSDLIWYERIPHHFEYNHEKYEKAMESLKSVDPRVIVFQGESSLTLFCWFHRFGIYGGNFAIFVDNYADSNIKTIVVPEETSEWCTAEMIREAMNGTFVYGESNRADLFRDDPDDVGMTWESYRNELNNQVNGIEHIVRLYETGKYLYYDLIVLTGFILDDVERMLNLQNDSLANWSIDSENFKQNGKFISEMIKKAIFTVNVKALRGIYAFVNSSTGKNDGFTPIAVDQIEISSENFNITMTKVVATTEYEVGFAHEMIIFNEGIRWKTPDRKPPPDRVLIKRFSLASSNSIANIVLIVIAILACIYLTILLFVRKLFTIDRIFILVGAVISNIYIFLFPIRDSEPTALHCSILIALFIVGVCTCFIALWSLLEMQSKILNLIVKPRTQANETFQASGCQKPKWICILLGISIPLIFIVIILFVSSSPFEAKGVELSLDDTFGRRQVEIPTRKVCTFQFNVWSIVMVVIGLLIMGAFFIRSIFVVFQIQMLKKAMKAMVRGRSVSASRSRTSQRPVDKRSTVKSGDGRANFPDSPHNKVIYFSCWVSLMLACGLISVLIPDHEFYVVAVSALLFDITCIILFHFENRAENH